MARPWMPLYVADYLRDTRRLTAAEHGAYLLLIMEYWTAGELPDDDRQLARIACMSTAEWRKALPNVRPFFTDDWKHKRIDAELARSAEISSKRSASAKQKHSISSANAQQKDTHAGATSQPQSQTQELRSKETRASALDDWPSDYREIFWSKYPHKVGKADAIKKLEAVRKRAVLVPWKTLMDGLDSYIRTKPPDRPWCNPATWLNQDRWTDQPANVSSENGISKSGNIIAAADNLVSIIDSFDGGERGPDGIRGEARPPHVRLLSQG